MLPQRLPASLAFLLFLATLPAYPQGNTPESEEGPTATVTVTGSRIARPELERLQPTVIVGSEQLEERAYTNVIDALNELPAFGVPANSPTGAQPSSFGVAQSFADFFSLGSQRTLTLVNGRRFVGSNTASIFGPTDPGQQVDLNTIPLELIDRVEVIAVGGAPIYGSDAISGTVNIILKDNFQGLALNGVTSIAEEGDGFNWRASALAGMNFAGDRGNVTANLEYNKAKGLLFTDRDITNRGLFFTAPADPNSPFDQVLIENRRVGLVNFNGLPMTADLIPQFGAGITDPVSGELLAFGGPDGLLVPYDLGADTGSLVNNIGGGGVNFAPLTNLLAPTERVLFTSLAHFDITDSVRVFGEVWYSNTRGTRLADQPVYNTLLFGNAGDPDGNLIISIDNPFLPAESRAIIEENLIAAGADPSFFYLARANTDISSGLARGQTDLYRGVLGIEGNIDFAGHGFDWEVSANYGRSVTESREPQIVQQNFLNALDAAVDPGSGEIVCAASLTPGGVVSAPVATISDTCAPLNLFGLGAPSQAARDYITTIADQTSTLTQRVFTADIRGPVLNLPAGPLQAVLGYENRRETSEFDPDAFFRQGLGRLIPIDPLEGDFETDEIFTEVLVPILSDEQNLPFVHSLQFEGAARYVDHSIAGGDTTWTAGLRFAPVEDITFRGNKTMAIRSPAITEAFNPTSQAFELADDPCDQRFIDAGPNPAQRAANCAAAGILQPFTSNIVDATAPVSVSGNPDLLNEEADSETFGFVLRPRWLPRMSLAVDWVSIDLSDAIVSLDAESTLEACYDSPTSPTETALCANVDRDADGQVTFVRTGFTNAGSKNFKGITAQLNYGVDVARLLRREAGSYGNVDFTINYFNLRDLTTRVGLGDVDHEAGEIGNARQQGAFTLNYKMSRFSWLLQGLYLGSSAYDVDEPAGTRDISGVGEWWLFNTTVGYRLGDNITLRAVVDNVFDRDPPFPAPGGGGSVTYFKGIFGRSYALSFNYGF